MGQSCLGLPLTTIVCVVDIGPEPLHIFQPLSDSQAHQAKLRMTPEERSLVESVRVFVAQLKLQTRAISTSYVITEYRRVRIESSYLEFNFIGKMAYVDNWK
ncbi:hypothetical protein TRAPUB_4275 [Trametes pubescens]|uniref:Uncharacterized protein n=1 Tax=Trametes pubescens TaxID=154538 RepID=A0A1M2VBM2_TRAPU|nr:hypothetical protein TRAPUB_4275 [Trametes pubescens]